MSSTLTEEKAPPVKMSGGGGPLLVELIHTQGGWQTTPWPAGLHTVKGGIVTFKSNAECTLLFEKADFFETTYVHLVTDSPVDLRVRDNSERTGFLILDGVKFVRSPGNPPPIT